MADLVFGRCLHPPFTNRLIPDDQNGAWDDLGQRTPVGIVSHTMVGTLWGTDKWFRRGAASTGLTDYGIGIDGTILRWNDPLGKPHPGVSANRAGWANGGSDGLEGDGPLFVRTQGINAINRDLVSIERDDQGQPYTYPFAGKQLDSFVKLAAHWFDYAKVPWDRFPVNPNLWQAIVTYFFHLEFATKGCPWGPVEDKIVETQNAIRGVLKAGQVDDAVSIPVDPATPVEPDHDALPLDYTLAGLSKRFGTLAHRDITGAVIGQAAFNVRGPISNAWMARAAAEKRAMDAIPPAADWVDTRNPKVVIDGQPAMSSIVTFDGRGSDNWLLFRPAVGIAWRWLV